MGYRVRFEVQGHGKTSARKRRRVYEAWDDAEARRLADADDTVVETVDRLPDTPPSENQLAYARGLGIHVPDDASSYDVSDMINFHLDTDEPADDHLRALSARYGVSFGRFTGKFSLYYRIMNALKEPGKEEELIAWYAYQVYLELTRRIQSTAIDGPNHPIIQGIVKQLGQDRSIIESIRRYKAHDLMDFGEVTEADGGIRRSGSKRTISYQSVSSLLRVQLGLLAPSSSF